jgi:hypothetical protein
MTLKENNIKTKISPIHAMKAYRGKRGIAPIIIHLGTLCRRVVNFTPWSLHVGEGTPVPIQ